MIISRVYMGILHEKTQKNNRIYPEMYGFSLIKFFSYSIITGRNKQIGAGSAASFFKAGYRTD